ncbi:MAG TPA: hypothetical protein VK155_15920 [Bacteroidales bacterium]|jgi:hypothetical protein|nr:hypothetical protein [Bacteroidales bacterium]
MIAKRYFFYTVFLTCFATVLTGQVYDNPAVGLKSVQTMEVLKVEASPDRTVLYLSVENRIKGGTFCADRNIYVICPDGTKLKLQKAMGIPQCPDTYRFRKEGEILEFSLVFPALAPGIHWIDVIEECSDNCFSVYGILLNNELSRKIDAAVAYVNRGQTDSAIGAYTKLISEAGSDEAGIAGSLYSDLISLLYGKGYTASAADYYRRLAASELPRKELYIGNLNFRGIKY